MGANLFHNLRIVAGQMAYPVLRVVDGGGEPAAGDRQRHPRLHVLFAREIMTVHSGISSLMHSGHCPSFQPVESIMMFVQVEHSGSRCAGQ